MEMCVYMCMYVYMYLCHDIDALFIHHDAFSFRCAISVIHSFSGLRPTKRYMVVKIPS